MNVLPISRFTSSFPFLTGVTRARQLLAGLIDWSASESPSGTLILDFRDVPEASASFLRESVLAFRDYVRAYQPDVFPVIANMTEPVREEFDILLRNRREAMLGCRLDNSPVPVEPVVLGLLEPGLCKTLDTIRARGQVTLAELRELSPPTSATTLSNRVASLIRQGFVVTSQEPNKRAYRFVLSEAGGANGS